eukprot:5129204-Pleurochrysis_carterae.AAC.3
MGGRRQSGGCALGPCGCLRLREALLARCEGVDQPHSRLLGEELVIVLFPILQFKLVVMALLEHFGDGGVALAHGVVERSDVLQVLRPRLARLEATCELAERVLSFVKLRGERGGGGSCIST